MQNKFIKINKLDKSVKNIFLNRFLIAFALTAYWSLLFVSCWISDNSIGSEWYVPLDIKSKGIFAYIFVLLLLPFAYGSAREINNLFFGRGVWLTFWLLFSVIAIFLILPNFAYITRTYYFPIKGIPITFEGDLLKNPNEFGDFFSKLLALFSITILISFAFLIGVLVCIIRMRQINEFVDLFLFVILVIIIAFGFFSIAFIGLLRSWLVLLFVICITYFTDIFSYIGGVLFGRKKISKVISPKKTLEGFWIGLLLTLGAGLLLTFTISIGEENHNSFEHLVNIKVIYDNEIGRWSYMILLILGISLIGNLGDFAFSYIKRNYNIKDYGDFFQQHGGVLDRFDSVLFTTTAYSLLTFFVAGITQGELFPQ
ncbi:MAG: phosphatidate cytidylyltransferase [Mycoplasmoidaceae bacterium]